jgi:DNA transposition AAA+ family ATPase
MAVQPVLKDDLWEGYNEALYERFMNWKDQSGCSVHRIAKMLRRSEALVSAYIGRNFKGDLSSLEKDILNLLKREEDLDLVSSPKFCMTSVAEEMWQVMQYADSSGKSAAILASSGTGKTTVIKEYKKRNPRTVLVLLDVSTRSMGSVLRLVTQCSGGQPRRATISEMLHVLIDRLKVSHRLLIFDDAHFLSWEGFELMRKLHDAAGIGVVYVGQERLYEQMKGTDNTAHLFDQIFSRIAAKRDDFKILKRDVVAIAESICPDLDKACIDFLYERAKGKGRFRIMINTLDAAIKLSKRYKEPLSVKLLREAVRFLMV